MLILFGFFFTHPYFVSAGIWRLVLGKTVFGTAPAHL